VKDRDINGQNIQDRLYRSVAKITLKNIEPKASERESILME
jgi:hypothetical protein